MGTGCFQSGVAGLVAHLGGAWRRLLSGHDTVRRLAASLGTRCRSASRVRGAICAFSTCWLLTYPLAGWLGSSAGIVPTSLVLASLTFAGVSIAWRLWPAIDSDVIPHQHPELPSEHPHLQGKPSTHAHSYVIDNLHHRWP